MNRSQKIISYSFAVWLLVVCIAAFAAEISPLITGQVPYGKDGTKFTSDDGFHYDPSTKTLHVNNFFVATVTSTTRNPLTSGQVPYGKDGTKFTSDDGLKYDPSTKTFIVDTLIIY